MKKLFMSLVFGGLLASNAFAQPTFTIREETASLAVGSGNSLVIDLPNTKEKEVREAWGDFIKTYKGKVKYDSKTKETVADDCTIKEMSPDKVDVIAKITPNSDNTGTKLNVWFDLGANTFLSSKDKPQAYPAGDKMVREFALSVSATMIEEELKNQEKALKEMEEALKKLEKEKTNRDKDISEYKENIKKQEDNIRKADEDIKTNLKTQGEKTTAINDQKKIVEETKERLKKAKKK
jgi:hypothetical protein